MIERLLLFGATGDLAGRFLLPALAELYDEGRLPDSFRVVATAIEDWDDEAFRRHAARLLEQHTASDVSAASREALVRALRYRKADFDDPGSVAEAVGAASGGSAAAAGSADAMTTAVGRPRATSRAKLGPDSTAGAACGRRRVTAAVNGTPSSE